MAAATSVVIPPCGMYTLSLFLPISLFVIYLHTKYHNVTYFPRQLQTARLHLRTGGEFTNRAAAHDPESRLPGHLVHVAALVTRSSHARGARLVSQSDQVLGDVPVGQQ